jgi:hypothetical protein
MCKTRLRKKRWKERVRTERTNRELEWRREVGVR